MEAAFLSISFPPSQGVGWGNANGAATYQCDFCPVDNTVLCVSGNGFVRFLRQQEGMLRPVQPSAGAAALEGAPPPTPAVP